MKVLKWILFVAFWVEYLLAQESLDTCEKRLADRGYKGGCMKEKKCKSDEFGILDAPSSVCDKKKDICCYKKGCIKLDMYMVIENSKDVSQDVLDKGKRAMLKLLDKLAIGSDATRVCVIEFSDKIKFHNSLDSGSNKQKLVMMINSIQTTQNTANMPAALQAIFTFAANVENGNRMGVKNVIVGSIAARNLSTKFINKIVGFLKIYTGECLFNLLGEKKANKRKFFKILKSKKLAKNYLLKKKFRSKYIYNDICSCEAGNF